jgi:hypothetical protein
VPQSGPEALVARARAEALGIADREGSRAIYRLLKDAESDLAYRLHNHPRLKGKGGESFTYAQMQLSLVQVRDVLSQLANRMGPEIARRAEAAAGRSGEQVAEYIATAEKHYKGVATALPIEEAALTDAAVAGTKASVLRRLMVEDPSGKGNGILSRYGFATTQWFEKELSKGLATRKPMREIREALIEQSPFLQQAPAHWAERVARTELHYAMNKGAHNAMDRAQEELGDMVRILVATFDNRTAGDSYNVHGEIRRMHEPFEFVAYDGEHEHFMTPPNRPNDREVVIAHRTSWPIPEGMRPKTTGEVEARYRAEKRKFHGRPHKMSTVPASAFPRG